MVAARRTSPAQKSPPRELLLRAAHAAHAQRIVELPPLRARPPGGSALGIRSASSRHHLASTRQSFEHPPSLPFSRLLRLRTALARPDATLRGRSPANRSSSPAGSRDQSPLRNEQISRRLARLEPGAAASTGRTAPRPDHRLQVASCCERCDGLCKTRKVRACALPTQLGHTLQAEISDRFPMEPFA